MADAETQETLAIIAEMDLASAREVCEDEALPAAPGDSLSVLQARLRAHLCGAHVEPEPEPQPEQPAPPSGAVLQATSSHGGGGASAWLKKENHHLLEENKRLKRDMQALVRAAGGEVDVDRLRKKLAACSAALAERDTLQERLSQLEAQLAGAGAAEEERAKAQATALAACERRLAETREACASWQERHHELERERGQAAAAVAECPACGAAAAQVETAQSEVAAAARRAELAEAEAADWQRACAALQERERALTQEHQQATAALQAELLRKQTCRSCKRLIDDLDDGALTAQEMERMINRADEEHREKTVCPLPSPSPPHCR